jgi:hypothetical protein
VRRLLLKYDDAAFVVAEARCRALSFVPNGPWRLLKLKIATLAFGQACFTACPACADPFIGGRFERRCRLVRIKRFSLYWASSEIKMNTTTKPSNLIDFQWGLPNVLPLQ